MWKTLADLFLKRPERELQDGERRALDEVPFLARLDAEQKHRFLALARTFLHQVQIDGAEGLKPTLSERAWIAASCSLLYVSRPDWPFPPVARVVVSPRKFDEKTWQPSEKGVYGGVYTSSRVGKGAVGVTRAMLEYSFRQPADGYHVGVHEFAHALDEKDHVFDGVPTHLPGELASSWLGPLEKARAAAGELRGILREYAAKDHSEAFAVAVETFFERPLELRRHETQLYDNLRAFFRQDPAAYDEAELRKHLDERAGALVQEWIAWREQESTIAKGRLVWLGSKLGLRLYVRVLRSNGKWARATPVNDEDLDPELARWRGKAGDERPVELDLFEKTARHLRPPGKTFLVWPGNFSSFDRKLERDLPLAEPAWRSASIAKAVAQASVARPVFATTLDGRRALVLSERADKGRFERQATRICRLFDGKVVKRDEARGLAWEIRVGDATLVLEKNSLAGVLLVAKGSRAGEKLERIGEALGAEGVDKPAAPPNLPEEPETKGNA
ncbi:MAG: zinc-dependent peptidase [Planctomycetota bacterium]|nr:zinc-dependent peptidase [Planctomycetota bacterium]